MLVRPTNSPVPATPASQPVAAKPATAPVNVASHFSPAAVANPVALVGAAVHSAPVTSASTDALFHAAAVAPAPDTSGIPAAVLELAAKNGFGSLVSAQGAMGTQYLSFQGGQITYSDVDGQIGDATPNGKAPTAALAPGATGDEVCRLQRALGVLGFLPQSGVTATYDAATKSAVSAFQKDRGLPVTGNYDAATAKAAAALLSATVSPPTAELKKGSTGAQVALLQRELTMLGFSTGGVDGDFGPKTEAALKGFQKARGETVDGVFGPQVRSQMASELPELHQVPDVVSNWIGSKGLPATMGSVAGELGLGALISNKTVDGKVEEQYQHGLVIGDPTTWSISVTGTGFEDLPSGVAQAAVNYGLGQLKGSTALDGVATFQFAHGSLDLNLATGAIEGIQQT